MTKDTKKLFFIFWVVVAVVWLGVGIIHFNTGDETVIAGMYLATAAISLVIALSFYMSYRKPE